MGPLPWDGESRGPRRPAGSVLLQLVSVGPDVRGCKPYGVLRRPESRPSGALRAAPKRRNDGNAASPDSARRAIRGVAGPGATGETRRRRRIPTSDHATLDLPSEGRRAMLSTRFRPDTRLDRGGHYVGSHGGSDGRRRRRGRAGALRRAGRSPGGRPGGALGRAAQAGGGPAAVQGRGAGWAGA